jgi:hypothetical protein
MQTLEGGGCTAPSARSLSLQLKITDLPSGDHSGIDVPYALFLMTTQLCESAEIMQGISCLPTRLTHEILFPSGDHLSVI